MVCAVPNHSGAKLFAQQATGRRSGIKQISDAKLAQLADFFSERQTRARLPQDVAAFRTTLLYTSNTLSTGISAFKLCRAGRGSSKACTQADKCCLVVQMGCPCHKAAQAKMRQQRRCTSCTACRSPYCQHRLPASSRQQRLSCMCAQACLTSLSTLQKWRLIRCHEGAPATMAKCHSSRKQKSSATTSLSKASCSACKSSYEMHRCAPRKQKYVVFVAAELRCHV